MHSTSYAHSLAKPDGTPRPPSQWEPLFTGDGNGHLEQVARRAGELAARFDASAWGWWAGSWHDVGKYSPEFQDYLRQQNGFEAHLEQQQGRVDHSTAGAQHASEQLRPWGRLSSRHWQAEQGAYYIISETRSDSIL